uniref:Uncharacterized protein n=1 Tax=Ascaris lumbricoides TaxID=6252 RepID=A0A0M3HMD8_ASCLU
MCFTSRSVFLLDQCNTLRFQERYTSADIFAPLMSTIGHYLPNAALDLFNNLTISSSAAVTRNLLNY